MRIQVINRISELEDKYCNGCKIIEEAGELAEAINKDLSDEEKMMEAGDVFIALTVMMQQYGFDIEDCAELAYKKIENREGAMVNGVFVKQSDL